MATNTFGIGVRKLRIFKMATEPDNSAPTYGDELEVGTTNAINASRSTANATADGDDKQVANITMTTGMSIEWTGWGVPVETEAGVFGHTLTDSQIDESMDDLAPYVGIGYIRTIMDNTNTKIYKAYFYYKCQAVQGNEDSTTMGTSLDLKTVSVTFNAVQPTYGPMRSIEEFSSEAEATSWIEGLAGASA